jgi:hypothetical protein
VVASSDETNRAIGTYRGVQSIGIGILGMALPIVTSLIFSGTTYFFVLLPLFGLIRGAQAVAQGARTSGITGIVLNLVAGLVTLTAAGVVSIG